MTGFELQTSGVGSDRYATTTVHKLGTSNHASKFFCQLCTKEGVGHQNFSKEY